MTFNGVRCTHESYTIDAFLNYEAPADDDVDLGNPHFIGRDSRIGMGVEDNKGRCILHGVTRVLDATRNAEALGLTANSDCSLTLLVRKIATGEKLEPAQYLSLPGFASHLMWSGSGASVPAVTQPNSGTGGHCCQNDH